ncbi:MAG: hypothetical protein HY904_16240 [Deltaproteobacteria bacterium]|nr:hypothetical protein [Deltaproteobacteria bacterium]
MLAASMLFSSGLFLLPASPAVAPVPLVAPADGAHGIQSVKKSRDEDESENEDDGEKGALDYVKMSLLFSGPDVAEEVQDGRVLEHLVGGLFAELGGHLWAPSFAYEDIEAPPAARTLGIAATVVAWLWLPFMIFWMVPYVGWVLGGIPFLLSLVVVNYFSFWVFPRALQFAYSDSVAAGGVSEKSDKKKSKKKKKKKKAVEEEEEE